MCIPAPACRHDDTTVSPTVPVYIERTGYVLCRALVIHLLSLCDSDARTIAILYESRDVPFKGMVSKLAADKSLEWVSGGGNEEGKAKFRVKGAFDITLSCYDSPMAYLEIRMSKVGDSALFLQDACVHVRETVQQKLKLAHIGAEDAYSLAFFCTCSQTSTQHMMKIEMRTPLPPKQAVCNYKALNQNLSEGTHLDWFVSKHLLFIHTNYMIL